MKLLKMMQKNLRTQRSYAHDFAHSFPILKKYWDFLSASITLIVITGCIISTTLYSSYGNNSTLHAKNKMGKYIGVGIKLTIGAITGYSAYKNAAAGNYKGTAFMSAGTAISTLSLLCPDECAYTMLNIAEHAPSLPLVATIPFFYYGWKHFNNSNYVKGGLSAVAIATIGLLSTPPAWISNTLFFVPTHLKHWQSDTKSKKEIPACGISYITGLLPFLYAHQLKKQKKYNKKETLKHSFLDTAQHKDFYFNSFRFSEYAEALQYFTMTDIDTKLKNVFPICLSFYPCYLSQGIASLSINTIYQAIPSEYIQKFNKMRASHPHKPFIWDILSYLNLCAKPHKDRNLLLGTLTTRLALLRYYCNSSEKLKKIAAIEYYGTIIFDKRKNCLKSNVTCDPHIINMLKIYYTYKKSIKTLYTAFKRGYFKVKNYKFVFDYNRIHSELLYREKIVLKHAINLLRLDCENISYKKSFSKDALFFNFSHFNRSFCRMQTDAFLKRGHYQF